jgi:hypothetical protein
VRFVSRVTEAVQTLSSKGDVVSLHVKVGVVLSICQDQRVVWVLRPRGRLDALAEGAAQALRGASRALGGAGGLGGR